MLLPCCLFHVALTVWFWLTVICALPAVDYLHLSASYDWGGQGPCGRGGREGRAGPGRAIVGLYRPFTTGRGLPGGVLIS